MCEYVYIRSSVYGFNAKHILLLNYVKKVEAAVAAGDKAAANEVLPVAIAEIEKAASKGIFHKNAAARKVSHITKAVNAMA